MRPATKQEHLEVLLNKVNELIQNFRNIANGVQNDIRLGLQPLVTVERVEHSIFKLRCYEMLLQDMLEDAGTEIANFGSDPNPRQHHLAKLRTRCC